MLLLFVLRIVFERELFECARQDKIYFANVSFVQLDAQQAFSFRANTQNTVFTGQLENWTNAVCVTAKVDAFGVGIEQNESKHAVQVLAHELNTAFVVQMNQRLAVTIGVIVELVLGLQLFVIVNLAVVDHPNVRHAWNANRLHAVQIVYNGQTMKAKSAIGKVAHTLEAKAVRTAMRNGKTTFDLFMHIDFRTKNTPDTAHFFFPLYFSKSNFQKLLYEF
jgi:S-adenosylmethionine/arginine decarboxylase-like enzyme